MPELQSAPRTRRSYALVGAGALAAVAILAMLLRCVAVVEPIGIDQSLWASAVRGMARGQRLYQDVWEQRPPGIYFVYLAAFEAFGWAQQTIVWLDTLAAAVTALLLYGIGRVLGDRLTGAAAACLYAALTMPAWMHGHGGFLERSVCETFIVVAVGCAAWCAVRFRQRPSLLWVFGLGVSAGAAVVMKPNAGIYFVTLLAWLTWSRGERRVKAMIAPAAVAAVGAVVIPVATLLWLWRAGLLQDARTAVIDFNRYYVAEGFRLGAYAIAFSKAVWLRQKTDPLWAAGSIGAVLALWTGIRERKLAPLPGLAIAWGTGAFIAIVVNGTRLFNTYFIQAWAPLALLAAWLLADVGREPARRRVILPAATAALMLLLVMQRGYPTRVFGSAAEDLRALTGRVDRATYLDAFGRYGNERGYSARANEEVARYVRARTTPDERIFVFGISGASIYFLSDRLTAHRFLRVNFFVATDFPDPQFRLEPVTRDLAERRPRYLIFERLHGTSEMAKAVDHLLDDPAIARLLSDYRLETRIEDFTLFRRRDAR